MVHFKTFAKMNESIVKVSRVKDGVQIFIHSDSLSDLAERNPENPLKIVDINVFLDKYVEHLQNYAESNDVESGCSHLEYLVEECIQEIYQDGEDCVTTLEEQEED